MCEIVHFLYFIKTKQNFQLKCFKNSQKTKYYEISNRLCRKGTVPRDVDFSFFFHRRFYLRLVQAT
jgi:hypothetical protein